MTNPANKNYTLADSLADSERDDPALAAAGRAMDHAMDRAAHPDDYVRPENLQATEPDEPPLSLRVVAGSSPVSVLGMVEDLDRAARVADDE